MTIRHLIGAVAIAVTVAACGESAAQEADVPADPSVDLEASDTAPAAGQASGVDVLSGTTALGDILVGPNGLTLYGFTNDVQAASTCYGTCADAWPPVIVSDDWTAGPGLDFGIFATTVRDDGQRQLVAGKWPLYYFAGDAVPGDVKGQGSGDVWFVVDTTGILITETPAGADPADSEGGDAVTTADTSLGQVLVDTEGLTLYGFLSDLDALPTCNDACADAWPPLLADGPDLPPGFDPTLFSVVERDDGTFQIRAGVWPLYRFAGDAAPGDVNGQGSGDVWFAAAPDGSLLRDATPAGDDGGSGDY